MGEESILSSKEQEDFLQCPCGKTYRSPDEYKIVFVKKDQCEIDILCANPACHLKELGYIKFKVDKEKKKIHVEVASFYSPYVTWNATRLGREKARRLLEKHLRYIVERRIDWKRIAEDAPGICTEKIEVHELEK